MKCPLDTYNLINQSSVEISNFALRYRYFLNWSSGTGGRIGFGFNQAGTPQTPRDLERAEIEPLRNRQIEQLRYLASHGNFYCATSRIDWRMVVGLGSDHVQETNMMLDHVHGIPYLPGSAIKGVVRSWVIQEHFGNDEKLATRDPDFLNVFGSQESAGKVQFLDALPASGVHFDIDIMNPHFSRYYTGSEFPTDFQSPNPINFLTLRGTHFQFLIIAKTAASLKIAKNWFTEAIKNRGFGAKSAVGYGYFRELNDQTNQLKYQFAKKLSLNEAYDIYYNQPDRRDAVYIDIEQLVDYFPKFAIIVGEEICEIESIGGIGDIHESLIEVEVEITIPSEFGKWVWEKTKDQLFERGLPAFPNLVYRRPFNRSLGNLSLDERKLLQDKLLQISSEFYYLLNSFSTERCEDFQLRLLQIQEDLESKKIFAELNNRQSLIDGLGQIVDDLENDAGFVHLSPDNRELLREKLRELINEHGDAEDQWTFIQPNWFYIILPDTGRIECGGIENGKLVLRNIIG